MHHGGRNLLLPILTTNISKMVSHNIVCQLGLNISSAMGFLTRDRSNMVNAPHSLTAYPTHELTLTFDLDLQWLISSSKSIIMYGMGHSPQVHLPRGKICVIFDDFGVS